MFGIKMPWTIRREAREAEERERVLRLAEEVGRFFDRLQQSDITQRSIASVLTAQNAVKNRVANPVSEADELRIKQRYDSMQPGYWQQAVARDDLSDPCVTAMLGQMAWESDGGSHE
jgi:hypothetical protein